LLGIVAPDPIADALSVPVVDVIGVALCAMAWMEIIDPIMTTAAAIFLVFDIASPCLYGDRQGRECKQRAGSERIGTFSAIREFERYRVATMRGNIFGFV
jgi:hypothetical protein